MEERGRVPAAEALGVNYRTLVSCCDSRRISRRMRQALVDFGDAGGDALGRVDRGEAPDDVDGDDPQGYDGDALVQRVAALEEENAELRELVDQQTGQLEELARRIAALEGSQQPGDDTEVVVAAEVYDEDQSEDFGQDWQPPRRRPGMPDAGAVTLEEQPDEEHAFGPAAALVTEWRQLRVGGEQMVSRVDRARTAVRRWELEAEMLGEFHLTLPPETYPLDDARRADHVRWRQEALAEARRELERAKRMRLMRRVLTLGRWRR